MQSQLGGFLIEGRVLANAKHPQGVAEKGLPLQRVGYQCRCKTLADTYAQAVYKNRCRCRPAMPRPCRSLVCNAMAWKVLSAYEIKGIRGHYSAPGPERPLEEAGKNHPDRCLGAEDRGKKRDAKKKAVG